MINFKTSVAGKYTNSGATSGIIQTASVRVKASTTLEAGSALVRSANSANNEITYEVPKAPVTDVDTLAFLVNNNDYDPNTGGYTAGTADLVLRTKAVGTPTTGDKFTVITGKDVTYNVGSPLYINNTSGALSNSSTGSVKTNWIYVRDVTTTDTNKVIEVQAEK